VFLLRAALIVLFALGSLEANSIDLSTGPVQSLILGNGSADIIPGFSVIEQISEPVSTVVNISIAFSEYGSVAQCGLDKALGVGCNTEPNAVVDFGNRVFDLAYSVSGNPYQEPNCFLPDGTVVATSTCSTTVEPGVYFLIVSVMDSLSVSTGTAVRFTDQVIGEVTGVNLEVVTPEPTTEPMMFLALAVFALVHRSQRMENKRRNMLTSFRARPSLPRLVHRS